MENLDDDEINLTVTLQIAIRDWAETNVVFEPIKTSETTQITIDHFAYHLATQGMNILKLLNLY